MAEAPVRLLEQPAPAQDAWKVLSLLVLRAVTEHAVVCDAADAGEFRQRVRQVMAQLEGDAEPSQVLIAAGGLAQSLASYNQRVQQRIDGVAGGGSPMISLLLDHLDQIYGDQDCIELRRRMREAASLPDGAAAQLGDCLDQLVQHAAMKKQQARELLDRLQDRITILERSSAAQPPAASAPEGGLSPRAEAEAAIRVALDAGTRCFIAVFYLHRMATTNARFGETVGNQVILFVRQHIASQVIKANDRLFRWSGPSFVALLERDESLQEVCGEVRRAAATPLSQLFETSTRSVYLPIKISGSAFAAEHRAYAEVQNQVETFLLQASGREGGN
jgi:GGDEF domain-containing protein